MQKKTAILLFAITFFALSCKEEPKGQLVTFAEACGGKYWAKLEKGLYKGERIAFPGYLSVEGMAMQSDTLILDLHDNADRKGKAISVSVRTHGGKNGIDKLKKTYTPGDLKIHTATGETLGSKDKVIIHGEHIGSPSPEQSCLFKAFIIEKG